MANPATKTHNDLGQPVGMPMLNWTPRSRPLGTPMSGRFCRLEPLDAAAHAKQLHDAHAADREGRNWTYMPYGPFASARTYASWIESVQQSEDPLFFAIVDLASEHPVGAASYLRIDPPMGVLEVGHVSYSPSLQRTPAATEAMYLMMRRAFDELGYRRYEWKCDSLNAPSRSAASRLGFRYEGTFRNAVVVKQRNRDTAWYSIVEAEWPALRTALEKWLAPANFDEAGCQQTRLSELTADLR